jgi:hypothetical protein
MDMVESEDETVGCRPWTLIILHYFVPGRTRACIPLCSAKEGKPFVKRILSNCALLGIIDFASAILRKSSAANSVKRRAIGSVATHPASECPSENYPLFRTASRTVVILSIVSILLCGVSRIFLEFN